MSRNKKKQKAGRWMGILLSGCVGIYSLSTAGSTLAQEEYQTETEAAANGLPGETIVPVSVEPTVSDPAGTIQPVTVSEEEVQPPTLPEETEASTVPVETGTESTTEAIAQPVDTNTESTILTTETEEKAPAPLTETETVAGTETETPAVETDTEEGTETAVPSTEAGMEEVTEKVTPSAEVNSESEADTERETERSVLPTETTAESEAGIPAAGESGTEKENQSTEQSITEKESSAELDEAADRQQVSLAGSLQSNSLKTANGAKLAGINLFAASNAYKMQKQPTKCKPEYSFTENGIEIDNSTAQKNGFTPGSTVTVTITSLNPNEGYVFDHVEMRDSYFLDDGNDLSTSVGLTQTGDMTWSFTMPEQPSSNWLVFHVVCVKQYNVSLTADIDQVEYGVGNNVHMETKVTSGTDIEKAGSVQYYVNGKAIGESVSYSYYPYGNGGSSFWYNISNSALVMGENSITAVYTAQDGRILTSNPVTVILTKADKSKLLSVGISPADEYVGTYNGLLNNKISYLEIGKSFTTQWTTDGLSFPKDVRITATRDGKPYTWREGEMEESEDHVYFRPSLTGVYILNAEIEHEYYSGSVSSDTLTYNLTIKERPIALELEPLTITAGETPVYQAKVAELLSDTNLGLAETDEIESVECTADGDIAQPGTYTITIQSVKIVDRDTKMDVSDQYTFTSTSSTITVTEGAGFDYTITIPPTASVNSGSLTIGGTVNGTGQVEVTVSSLQGFQLVNADGSRQLPYELKSQGTVLTEGGIAASFTASGSQELELALKEPSASVPAGEYVDTLTFTAAVTGQGEEGNQ